MADARSERHPAVRAQPGPEERHGHFISEAWAELKKVEWPGQAQVIQGTVVVLIACVVVGTYLYLNDLIWKPVVSKVFLGQ
jgi:preprotein translocase subunit SecE